MRIVRTQTEDYLRKTRLPLATKSYTVISHGSIIDTLRTKLEDNGFNVKVELYKAEDAGDVAMGFIQIESDKDPDMGMTFNWTNSYNKKIRFGCSVGGFIYDNEVPFISSSNEASWLRKHTGTADVDAFSVMDAMIESANEHFDNIITMKNKFKSIIVSRKEYAKLIGLLYLDKKILTPTQVGVIRDEYDKPSFDYQDKGTLWELYKMIMYSVSDNSPKKWYEQQMQISAYIQVMYNIAAETNQEDATDNMQLEFDITAIEESSPVAPCVGHDQETIKDEMESIDNLIAAQNLIQEPLHGPIESMEEITPEERLEEIRTELDNESVSYGELVELQELTEFIEEDDVQLLEAAGVPEFDNTVKEMELPDSILVTKEMTKTEVLEEYGDVLTEEQIEIIKEEHGVVETGNPDDGFIGSTADNHDDLFDLIDEVEETEEDEVPWFTNENAHQVVEEKQSFPEHLQEELDDMLLNKYNNRRRVVNTIEEESFIVFELDSQEFFVLDK